MISAKCFKCGFVTSSDNQKCKRCGASLNDPASNPRRSIAPERAKRKMVVFVSLVAGAAAFIAAFWLVSSAFSPEKPSSAEVVRMLYSDDALKLPLVAAFPNELTTQINNNDLQRDSLLENYRDGQILHKLGLITLTVKKDKNEQQDCWRYRIDPMFSSSGSSSVKVPDREGPYETCQDIWNYHTSIEYVDPEIIDKAVLGERLRSLIDISPPLPNHDRSYAQQGGVVTSTNLQIGSLEVVEVSDAVAGNRSGTYSVGFKFRVKPNSLGDLFDVNSPVHKSLPPGIRQLFKYKFFESGQPDKRLLYIANAQKEGLTFGHAELVTEGVFSRKWKIAKVYFDQVDKTQYAYRQIE